MSEERKGVKRLFHSHSVRSIGWLGNLSGGAFTLTELLIAVVITLIVMIMLLQVLGLSSSQWRRVSENAEAFQSARAAFDSITRTLSQATLNTEYDYYNAARQSRLQIAAGPNGTDGLKNFVPDAYGRLSGLHFISGKNLVNNQQTHSIFFQAPLDFTDSATNNGASGKLNAVGYFVRFGSDDADRPSDVPANRVQSKERFRLMQYSQPTSWLDVYRDAQGTSWFKNDVDPAVPSNAHLLAENIVVFVVLPKLPDEQQQALDDLAVGYEYDSRTPWSAGKQPVQMHQLPPIVRVLMIAIDETSAQRGSFLGASFQTWIEGQSLFEDPVKFSDDLNKIESELIRHKANYRVFQADVPIRSAKWSL